MDEEGLPNAAKVLLSFLFRAHDREAGRAAEGKLKNDVGEAPDIVDPVDFASREILPDDDGIGQGVNLLEEIGNHDRDHEDDDRLEDASSCEVDRGEKLLETFFHGKRKCSRLFTLAKSESASKRKEPRIRNIDGQNLFLELQWGFAADYFHLHPFFNPSICLISPSVIYKPPCKRIDQLPRKAGKRKPFP